MVGFYFFYKNHIHNMAIEFLFNFCHTALHGTWVVTHNRGLRSNNRHTKLRVYCVTLIVGTFITTENRKADDLAALYGIE
jgi:hypothetical protein